MPGSLDRRCSRRARACRLPGALLLPPLLLPACASPPSEGGGRARAGGVDYPGLERPAVPHPGPRPLPPPEEVLTAQGRLGLRLLRARAARASLEEASRLEVPPGPFSFGGELPLKVHLAHRLLEDVRILAPEPGPLLVLRLRIRRWLPLGATEILESNPVVRLPGPVRVAPGQPWVLETAQALGQAGDPASLWEITLSATLRCDGVQVGDEVLPVQEVALAPARFLALPPGWEAVAPDALAVLARAARMEEPAADRHLLVAAALLQPPERPAGVRTLMEALDAAPGRRRTLTILAALRWLTGQDLGDSPVAWQDWWRRQGGRSLEQP